MSNVFWSLLSELFLPGPGHTRPFRMSLRANPGATWSWVDATGYVHYFGSPLEMTVALIGIAKDALPIVSWSVVW